MGDVCLTALDLDVIALYHHGHEELGFQVRHVHAQAKARSCYNQLLSTEIANSKLRLAEQQKLQTASYVWQGKGGCKGRGVLVPALNAVYLKALGSGSPLSQRSGSNVVARSQMLHITEQCQRLPDPLPLHGIASRAQLQLHMYTSSCTCTSQCGP